jgi:uncharacterized protein YkwD
MSKFTWHYLLFLSFAIPLILGFSNAFAQLDTTSIEQELTDKINEYRQEQGLNPLHFDQSIKAVAKKHNTDLERTGLFQHETPGTKKLSTHRSYEAGFRDCGISSDIAKYYQVKTTLTQLRKDIADYNKKYQLYKTQPNNIALKNWLIQAKPQLEKQRAAVIPQIDYVTRAVNDGRVGTGFSENLALLSDADTADYQTLVEDIIIGWKNSAGHNRVMLEPAEKIGISVEVDERNNRVLVVANFC